MASVFLSYDRDDLAAAGSIARALEKAGHRVWWDRHIKGGAQYSKEIEAALKSADAVVVLWSERSVESAWVRDEAAAGRDTNRLVPVRLDSTEPPMGFRQYQTIDLTRGRLRRATVSALLGAVDGASGAPAEPLKRPSRTRLLPTSRLAWLIGSVALVLAVVGGLMFWKLWTKSGEVVLSVGAAGTDAASQSFARDLAIKLGTLQTRSETPVRLVEAADSKTADLAFEAGSSGPANASLVLKLPKDSTILWSKDFEQMDGRRPDLVQQVSNTAGRILNCATEGLGGPVKLKRATLKAYLNACAQLSDTGAFDDRQPLLLLLEVVEDSPRFRPAWAALLLLEADLVSPEVSNAEPDPRLIAELRRHIAEARRIDPMMPEAAIAEAALLPPRNFIGRMRLIEQAEERGGRDPQLLLRLAGAFSESGRLREAVNLADQAVKLDPLSPLVHSSYTALITYSGNFNAARRELAKAERLWPGTASVHDAQYRFHLRYGDPQIALRLFERFNDTGGRGPRLLLAARQNPGPATIEPFLEFLRERLRHMENPSAGIGFATLGFAYFDQKEDLFSTLLNWPKADDIAIIAEVLFRPEFAEEQKDPRILLVAKRAGLLDYWRQSGDWPDFCFEPGFPYDCKAEAAKMMTAVR